MMKKHTTAVIIAAVLAGICQFGCDDSSHGNDDITPDQPNDPTACKTEGFVNCNGICIDPNTSNNYCGANVNCENYEVCSGDATCQSGRCSSSTTPEQPEDPASCKTEGFVKCDGLCIDPNTSNKYCGANENCENYEACSGDDTCQNGKCTSGTSPELPDDSTPCKTEGFIRCNGICIDPNTSNNYCGANENCENYEICKSTDSCFEGRCRPTACEPDEHRYLGACEKDSLEHCGAHNFACATEIEGWVTGVCENHQCIPTECAPGECPEEPSGCKANTECNAWEKCEEGQCVDIDNEDLECYDNERLVNGVCVHEGMLEAKPGDPCDPEWQNYTYCNDENHSVYCWFDGENYTLMKDECEKCQYVANRFKFIATCDNAYSAQCEEEGDTFLYCDDRMEYGKVSSKYICTETMNGGLVAFDQFELGDAIVCVTNTCNEDGSACAGTESCDLETFQDRCTADGNFQHCYNNEVVTQDCISFDAECHLVEGYLVPGVVSGGCFTAEEMCDEPGAETQICKVDMTTEMAGLGKEVCTATEDGAYVKLFTGFTSYCNEDNPELSSECNDDFTACKEVLPCEYGVDNDSCDGSVLTYCSEDGEYKTQDCAIVGMECLSFSGLFEQTVASCMSPVKCKNEGMLEETCNSHKVYTSYCAKAQDNNLYRIEVLSDICANGYGPCNDEGTACLEVEACDPTTYKPNCTADGTLLTCNSKGKFVESLSCADAGKQCLIIDNYTNNAIGVLGGCYAEFDLCETAGESKTACFAYNTYQGAEGTKVCYATTTADVNVQVIEGYPNPCKYGQGDCNDEFTACSGSNAATCDDEFEMTCTNNVLLSCNDAKKVVKTNCAATDETCHVYELDGKKAADCLDSDMTCTTAGETMTKCHKDPKQGVKTSQYTCTQTQSGALFWIETSYELCSGGAGSCAEGDQACVPPECDVNTHVNTCEENVLVTCEKYRTKKRSCEDSDKVCGTVDGVGQCLATCTNADTTRTTCSAVSTYYEQRGYKCTDVDGQLYWLEDTEAYKRCSFGCSADNTTCR